MSEIQYIFVTTIILILVACLTFKTRDKLDFAVFVFLTYVIGIMHAVTFAALTGHFYLEDQKYVIKKAVDDE